MIKVVARNYIKSEKINEFISLVKKLEIETKQKDTGCIVYELFQETNNPQILTFIEEWESKEALENHIAAKHFQEIMPVLTGFAEKPVEISIYQKVL